MRMAGNRRRNVVTPSGLEKARDTAMDQQESQSPTEGAALPASKKRFTKQDGSKVAKLALVAANAVRNADLHRALDILAKIHSIGDGQDGTAPRLALRSESSE